MKAFLTFVFLLTGFGVFAQQLPQYAQYTFNELLVNPAITGLESYWDLKTGYRSQWTGLQGAPVTSYITLSIPLNKNYTLNDYSQMLSNSDNPYGRNDAQNYRSSISHSGVGLSVVSDKSGLLSQTHIDFSYAYHVQITDKLNIASGASFGLNNSSFDVSQLRLANPVDPFISNGSNHQVKPELALGIWCYGASFFLGASVQQLMPQVSSTSTQTTGNKYSQYFITAGYKVFLSDDVTLLPSLMIKPDQGTLAYDINSKLAFTDRFWIGGAYRKNDAVSGSFGFNLASLITLGYTYEYSTTELNNVSNGTHEIMLGLFLNNNYNTTSPRHSW
jgi:type IX secretion system PorP/SprF family membrane protein